jgi:hypothetical protein
MPRIYKLYCGRVRHKEMCKARTMLHRGHTMDDVLAALGNRLRADEIMTAIEKARWIHRRDHTPTAGVTKTGALRKSTIAAPPGAFDERDRRARLLPRSLTASLMGDPLPGYSAAELRDNDTPSIISDPLDALVFGRDGVLTI